MTQRSLSALLNGELRTQGESGFVDKNVDASGATAVMSHGDRTIAVLALEDVYVISYSARGRRLAGGLTADVSEVVRTSCEWADGCSIRQLAAAAPFIEFTDLDLAFERGEAKEYRWQSVLDEAETEFVRFRELALLASRSPVLRKLYPHIGHRFALSKDEYSHDALVSVFLTKHDWYTIFSVDAEGPEFEGDATQLISYLERKLGD